MAVLTDQQRIDATVSLCRFLFVKSKDVANVDTIALRDAINAADDWTDANAAAYNNALPTTFKNAANTKQKAMLLCIVLLWRSGIDPEGVF
jgi:hypothetical protein